MLIEGLRLVIHVYHCTIYQSTAWFPRPIRINTGTAIRDVCVLLRVSSLLELGSATSTRFSCCYRILIQYLNIRLYPAEVPHISKCKTKDDFPVKPVKIKKVKLEVF